MKTKKLLPENMQIHTPAHRASATGLMGFASTLPECPSRLPDGTILDYSAVDETWKDVDFPEREPKAQTVAESRQALEESFFRDYRESNRSQQTPNHLLKHMTRVQAMAAMTPSKDETVVVTHFPKVEAVAATSEEQLAEAVNEMNAILEGNDLVIEADSLSGFLEGLKAVLEGYELSDEDCAAIQAFIGEASAQAKANKTKRRDMEVAQQVDYNKAQAAAASKKDPLNPLGKPRLSAVLKPAAKPFVKWSAKPTAAS
jgi:hypothetical protein